MAYDGNGTGRYRIWSDPDLDRTIRDTCGGFRPRFTALIGWLTYHGVQRRLGMRRAWEDLVLVFFCFFFYVSEFFFPGPPFIEMKQGRETRMERFLAMFYVRMYVCGNEHSHRIDRHLIDWVRIDTLWHISSCRVLNLDQYVMIVSRFFRWVSEWLGVGGSFEMGVEKKRFFSVGS